jgi:hypothetical protein
MRAKKWSLFTGIFLGVVLVWLALNFWHIKSIREYKALAAISEATLRYIQSYGIPPRTFTDLFNSGILKKHDDYIVLISKEGVSISGGPWYIVGRVQFSFPQHVEDLEIKDGQLIEKAIGCKKDLVIMKSSVLWQWSIDRVNQSLWSRWQELEVQKKQEITQ